MLDIDFDKAMELFRHHEKVKFIIPGIGEREYDTIEFKNVVDSLEKQIPKKTGNCGVCGNCGTFGVQTKNAYCFNCGQKIDWK